MAFTLQQRVNICKGVPLDTEVNFVEKVYASLRKFAAQLKKRDLLKESLPQFSTFNPTEAKIEQWCLSVLDSACLPNRMLPSIISDPAMETNGISSTDEVIDAACQWNICAFAV